MSASSAIGLADAVQRLTASRLGARERRRFRRAPLVIGGRMLDASGQEHDCRTADLSPGDTRIATPVALETGQRIVLYLEGFGRLSGAVARPCGENEFAIIFDVSPHKREKMAEALIWLMNKSLPGLEDDAPRSALREGRHYTRIETEDGRAIDGEILDFSLAGMTVRSPRPAPPLGAWIRVGGVYGRVARTIDGGFAVDFAPPGARSPG